MELNYTGDAYLVFSELADDHSLGLQHALACVCILHV